MNRFKAEWSTLVGNRYCGITYEMQYQGRDDLIDDEFHARELEFDRKYRAVPGEGKRRRKLQRT
ncbi:hypothetical protein ABIA25_000756 [Sinorhizobium fredii]